MSLLKERDKTDVFVGGEVEKSSIDPRSKLAVINWEVVWFIVFTAFALAALAMHYVGFGLTAVAATFLSGPALRLLLNTLRG